MANYKEVYNPYRREYMIKAVCPHCGSDNTGFINMGGACCGYYCRNCNKNFN